MISILIPIYNWNISDLVTELNRQITTLEIEVEVIFYDDFSTDKNKVAINETVINQFGFKFVKSLQNRGIADALNFLSTLATYDWLIYLDADVIPVKSNFIKTYLHLIKDQNKVLCGGLLYQENKPIEGILRWKYGRKYEVQTTEEANENPFLNFKTCNFLIHKSVLEKTQFKSENNLYGGIDTLFGLSLKKKKIEVVFIENRVYHYGLEDSVSFLRKTDLAVDSMIRLYENQDFSNENTRLVDCYLLLKKYKLAGLFKFFLEVLQPFMNKNLKSDNPSIYIFQFYKLYLLFKKIN